MGTFTCTGSRKLIRFRARDDMLCGGSCYVETTRWWWKNHCFIAFDVKDTLSRGVKGVNVWFSGACLYSAIRHSAVVSTSACQLFEIYLNCFISNILIVVWSCKDDPDDPRNVTWPNHVRISRPDAHENGQSTRFWAHFSTRKCYFYEPQGRLCCRTQALLKSAISTLTVCRALCSEGPDGL